MDAHSILLKEWKNLLLIIARLLKKKNFEI